MNTTETFAGASGFDLPGATRLHGSRSLTDAAADGRASSTVELVTGVEPASVCLLGRCSANVSYTSMREAATVLPQRPQQGSNLRPLPSEGSALPLSYEDMVEPPGFEPGASCLQDRRSTNELRPQ